MLRKKCTYDVRVVGSRKRFSIGLYIPIGSTVEMVESFRRRKEE